MPEEPPKTFTLAEAEADVIKRLRESDEQLVSHSYPIDALQDGTVVTIEVMAERDADWAYEEGEPLGGDPYARPVDHELDPAADFVLRPEGSFGPEWLVDATWVAEETGIGDLEALLDEAGVDYETVRIDEASHIYLHEDADEARKKTRDRLLRAFHDSYPDYEGPDITSISDMVG